MKPTIRHETNAGVHLTHIEAAGCIVNIREGLHDRHGRAVTSIEILPDEYVGEPRWRRFGPANTRVVQLKQVVR
jgi:hypothetical protein